MVDIVDPFAAPTITDPFAAPPEPATGIVQGTKVAARAASPYATVAGAGALMGAPFGLAPAGAALGVGALGAADLLTGLYNVAAPRMGTPTFTQPSTAIEQLYGRVGIGAEPETEEQRMLAAGVRGAAAGYGQAQAFNRFAPMFTNPAVQNAMRSLGATPFAQGGAGFGAGVGAQTAQELGFGTGGQLAGSLIGSMVGGKTVQGGGRVGQTAQRMQTVRNTPTTDALKTEVAGKAYKVVDDSNLAVSQKPLMQIVDDIRNNQATSRYIPELDTSAKQFLDVLESYAQSPQSLTQLDALRGRARDMAANATTSGEKTVLGTISRRLNETLKTLDPNDLVPLDPSKPTAATDTVRQNFLTARDAFSKAAKSSEIEQRIHNAMVADDPLKALRSQFTSLWKDTDTLKSFTPAEQNVIRQFAEGNVGSDTLKALESLMPGFSRSAMFGNFVAALASTIGGLYGGPAGLLLGTAPGAIGRAAQTARSAQAVPYANQFAAAVRAGAVQDPYTLYYRNMMLPVGQEYLRSQQP